MAKEKEENKAKLEKAAPVAEKKENVKKESTKKEKAKTKKEKPVKEKKEIRKVVIDPKLDPFETIQFVLMTEKCVRMIESQNKLVFIVRRNSGRQMVRKAVENAFQSPVSGVTTMIDQKGRKRAYVKFAQANAAGDIAIRLGIL
jgi:large subunit ribosomal protein L23